MSRRAGIIRTRFQLETVEEFRKSLVDLGSYLLVAHEKPEVFMKQLVAPDLNHTVVYTTEICSEEKQVEESIKEMFKA